MGEALNRSEYELQNIEQYESLVSAIPGGIVITAADDDFTILFANPGYYAMVGYEKHEHIAKFQNTCLKTLLPDERIQFSKEARTQLAQSGEFGLKAKIVHKEKGYIWTQFSGKLAVSKEGNAIVYIVIADISEHIFTLEKLQKEKSFNEMIATLSEEAFFDCDLILGTMRYSRNFAAKLGVQEVLPDYKKALVQLGLMDEDEAFQHEIRFLKALDEILEDEIQLTLANGDDAWYLCRYNVVKNFEGLPIRVIGKFIDITRHKIQIDELSELAQKDQLTGLYNKKATESLIKETLKMRRMHDDNCALLIIDIDNFKNINDTLGHLYGDAVLTQLAEHLKAMFRSEDVVGRVGGDEFFVFLKNYRSEKVLMEKAREICYLFHKTYSEKEDFVTISASIGIALCPEHGTVFNGLYKKADAALYDAKARGKNCFSFYHQTVNQSYVSARTEIDAGGEKKSFKDNKIEYVFKLLYDSENPVASIQAVLQLVTESYGFSRGYIFETSADGKTTSNTFEWCAKGISAEIEKLQKLPIEAVETANNSFIESGMFILKQVSGLPRVEREILEPQGIQSMFQFGIIERGKPVGFIGFDDCIDERIPLDGEIDEICTVCHVLATFLLKHRSSEREMLHHRAIETAMDNMNSFTYVIERESYRVLYENQRVIDIGGTPAVGKKCYSAYRGNSGPCDDCPMSYLDTHKDRHSMEINNEKLGIYMRTEAVYIDWSGDQRACLICSTDISQYKAQQH